MPSTMPRADLLEAHILEHYAEIKPQAEAEGDHTVWISRDDQTVTHLRNLGWSDIAIGAYLVAEAIPPDAIQGYCPATLMLGALYFRAGSVR